MKYLTIAIALASILFACKNKSGENAAPGAQPAAGDAVQLPADFVEFYKKFHADSLYQVNHIQWPLQGDTIDSTTNKKNNIFWKPESWFFQKADFDRAHYTVEVDMMGDFMVIERIVLKSMRYGLERRFAKQPEGEWAMIYYSDMQER
jgi:hypothetical protein